MNKIDDLTNKLRELLASGAFPPGARFPSEYELQERFAVSRATANKAVSLLAAEGLLERGVRGSGTYVKKTENFPLGWIAAIDDLSHPYNMGMIAGAAQEAFGKGYMLSIIRPDPSGMEKLISKLSSSDCLGVLWSSYHLGVFPADFPKPVIYLDSGVDRSSKSRKHSVTCDNYGAAYEMMSRILNSGKKNAVILGIESTPNRLERMRGFTDALKKFGADKIEKRKFVMHHGSRHEVKLALQKILRQWPEVDFIATDSDDIVLRIMQAYESKELARLRNITLSGFGNIQGIIDLYHIPSVDQHPWHIGVEAVKSLLDIVKNGEPEQPIRIEVSAEIVNTEYI